MAKITLSLFRYKYECICVLFVFEHSSLTFSCFEKIQVYWEETEGSRSCLFMQNLGSASDDYVPDFGYLYVYFETEIYNELIAIVDLTV